MEIGLEVELSVKFEVMKELRFDAGTPAAVFPVGVRTVVRVGGIPLPLVAADQGELLEEGIAVVFVKGGVVKEVADRPRFFDDRRFVTHHGFTVITSDSTSGHEGGGTGEGSHFDEVVRFYHVSRLPVELVLGVPC